MKPLGPHDPRRAGRHRLIAVIGQGAMGRVLLGRSPDGRLVAVKMIHRHLAQNPEFRARFRLEVQASQRVTGAYTAAVMDADPDAAEPWLASVFVPGPSLRAAVDQSGPMPLGGLRLLTAGLASALMEIHRAGMVHRDLKPTNVLLAEDGPRVIDFGIARALEGDIQLTSTGSVVGSPAFMSPEQAEGHQLTTASDVFSVGAMLVLAATGESPFLGASTPQTLYNVVHNRADTTRVPPVLRGVVEACLDKNPAYRPTPPQLLQSVEAITARAGWAAAVRQQIAHDRSDAERWVALDGRVPESAKRRGGRVRWVAAAAVATLVAAGGASAVLLTHGESVPPDPLANRKLELSDEQLRLVDTCKLLSSDVLGSLGTPDSTFALRSTTCAMGLRQTNGRQTTVTLYAGTDVPATEYKDSGVTVAGRPILDSTFHSSVVNLCGRAALLRQSPRIGIEVNVKGSDTESCELAMSALKAVIARLASNPPLVSLPRQSAIRMDPCTAVDQSVVDSSLGAGVKAAPVDVHKCKWSGAEADVTVELTETKRVDTGESKFTNLRLNGGQLGPLDVSRSTDDKGECVTYHMVRSTLENRGEMVIVTVHPKSTIASDNACAPSDPILMSVLNRLRAT
ncbi:serine/threonine-protein kinase [Nocardia sp. NPDC050412]|uniref:serine/threonine-protein kinase n=1 Tax=Nocardia sp. NPDC050412 TaxID=3364320 RepID=UPI0037BDE598